MAKAYAVKGTTDESTVCDLCGRVELKATVMLVPLDADGNADGDVVYFGRSCAAKAAGWTLRELNAGIKRAADDKRAAEQVRRNAVREAEQKFLADWYTEHYGTPDLHKAAERAGMSPVRTSEPAIHALRKAQTAGTVPTTR